MCCRSLVINKLKGSVPADWKKLVHFKYLCVAHLFCLRCDYLAVLLDTEQASIIAAKLGG
jgi:hypothetical protein